MALSGSLNSNVPSNTYEIVFNNPSLIDSITYSNLGITYPSTSSYTLSQDDFALFYTYKSQLYNGILQNFPNVTAAFYLEIPVCRMEIQSLGSPNILQYYQTSTASPITLVYNISYNRSNNIATFAARSSQITVTLQEYLQAFQMITLYAKQVALA